MNKIFPIQKTKNNNLLPLIFFNIFNRVVIFRTEGIIFHSIKDFDIVKLKPRWKLFSNKMYLCWAKNKNAHILTLFLSLWKYKINLRMGYFVIIQWTGSILLSAYLILVISASYFPKENYWNCLKVIINDTSKHFFSWANFRAKSWP